MNVIAFNKIEHDVIQKPVPTFWHHALAGTGKEIRGNLEFEGPTMRWPRSFPLKAEPKDLGCRRLCVGWLTNPYLLTPFHAVA